MSFMYIADTLGSLKQPERLMNFQDIFSKDWRVSYDIYFGRIVFIVSKTVFWQNLYVFYNGGLPYIF